MGKEIALTIYTIGVLLTLGECLRIAVTYLLLCSLTTATWAADPKMDEDKKLSRYGKLSCRQRLGLIINSSLGVALVGLGTALIIATETQHEVASLFSEKKHVGFGIYLDPAAVIARFTPTEQALFKDPKQNRAAIIALLNEKLTGGYDYAMARNVDHPDAGKKLNRIARNYTWGIDGEQFFEATVKERGVCRHKAVLMVAMLKHVGIQAQYQSVVMAPIYGGQPLEQRKHAVVYLPESQEFADPTENYTVQRTDFEMNKISYYTNRIGLKAGGPK